MLTDRVDRIEKLLLLTDLEHFASIDEAISRCKLAPHLEQPDQEPSPLKTAALGGLPDSNPRCIVFDMASDDDIPGISVTCATTADMGIQTCVAQSHSAVQTDGTDEVELAFTQVDPITKAAADLASLRALRGYWQKMQQHTVIHASDVIRPRAEILSADSVPVLLDGSDIGTIWSFDEDGDAHAYFPGLASKCLKIEIIIFRQDYMKLDKLMT